jgi:hypothetical protein
LSVDSVASIFSMGGTWANSSTCVLLGESREERREERQEREGEWGGGEGRGS